MHRVLRRGLHRVVGAGLVLECRSGDLCYLRRGLVRLGQRLARDLLRRVQRLLRGLGDLGVGLGDIVLEARELALDALQGRLGDVARALLHLLEGVLHVLPDLLGGLERLRGALGRLACGLQHPGGRVLDVLGDLLCLLRRLLHGLGELGEVLDRRGSLLDRVPLGAKLGRVAGVDEEQVVGGDDVVLPVDPLARLLHLDHATGADGGIAGDARFRVHERSGALVVLALRHRLEQALLAGGQRQHLLDVAEHLLDELRAGDGSALLAVLVARLSRARHLARVLRVPAGSGDLRDLIEGVHLLDQAPDVLPPYQLRRRRIAELGLLEQQLPVVDVDAEASHRRALHEEVVVGQVVLDDVVVDDLAVLDVRGQVVAARDLGGEIAVLHVLVGLRDGALVEAVAFVHARHHQAARAVGGEHDLDVRDLALADALELALVAELDLDGGAGLELLLLAPLAADVREVEPEPAGLVHVVGDADPDDRALQLRIRRLPVDHELEVRDETLVVGQGGNSPHSRQTGRRGTAVVSSKRPFSSIGPESATMRSRARRSQERPAGRPAATAASGDLHHARRGCEVRRALQRAFAGGGSGRGEIITRRGRRPPRPPCSDRITRPRHGDVDVPRAACGPAQVLLPPPGPHADRAATSARARRSPARPSGAGGRAAAGRILDAAARWTASGAPATAVGAASAAGASGGRATPQAPARCRVPRSARDRAAKGTVGSGAAPADPAAHATRARADAPAEAAQLPARPAHARTGQ